jgi:poly(3-hydroxybutyrate) depolymerase
VRPALRRRRALRAALTVLAAFASVVALAPSASGQTAPTPAGSLPRLNITSNYVTGISSGGYMATQLQVAYSSRWRGAGIFSAGPYYCAQGSLTLALTACTADTAPTQLPSLIAQTDRYEAEGRIDSTSNLAGHRTWFFWGTRDRTVAGSVADDLAAYYRHYDVPLSYRNTTAAGHAWLSELGPNACDVTQPPFINNCGAAVDRDMLGTVLGSVKARNTGAAKGVVLAFPQDSYAAPASVGAGDTTRSGAGAIGMGSTGYAYVPSSCADGAPCSLVVALHGCRQTAGEIGTTFVERSGLNQYADSNRFVVLYPQARIDESFGNPKGCWDWWGYLGPNDGDYATRDGKQMQTVMNMVSALGG